MITLLACTGAPVADADDTGAVPPETRPWTVAIFMNGDNDLEEWVTHDLNELEAGDPGEEAWVVVQADRIEGYDTSDGDWTDARRYAITHDTADAVVSPVVESIGEVDMGDPDVLADFVSWTAENYPSERLVLVLWDHGDGWTVTSEDAERPSAISYDDTSESAIGVVDGALTAALDAHVAEHGPVDLIGFDGCNMGAYEVAWALRDHAETLSLSQSWVGWEGMQYTPLLDTIGVDPGIDTRTLADQTASDAVTAGFERTWAAVDTAELDAVHAGLDALAAGFLDAEGGVERFTALRQEARSTEILYRNWYVDLGDLAAVSDGAMVGTQGAALAAATDAAVIGAYGDERFTWTSGLSVFAATDEPGWIELYAEGPWAADSRWDELLMAASELTWEF